MCWEGEGPEFMSETRRRAAKEYGCDECGMAIVAGERYVYLIGKWEGDLTSYRFHSACRWLANRLGTLLCDGGYAFGQMIEHLDELARWERPRWQREGGTRPSWDRPTFVYEGNNWPDDRLTAQRPTEDVIEEERELLLLAWEAIQQKHSGLEFEAGGEG